MAFVYLLDITNVIEEDIRRYWNELDENRKSKITSIHNIDEKKLSFGVGIITSWILSQHNLPKESLTFTPDNKPYINDWLYISISHGGKYACVAISNKPIGVDIQENIGYLKHIEDLHFSLKDKGMINSDIHKFYEIWCQKEAYIKLFGYKELKEIPSHIDHYYYHNFYFDSHYGSVLTEDKTFILIKKELKKIIDEIHLNKSKK